MKNLVEIKKEWIADAMAYNLKNLKSRMGDKTEKNFFVGVNTIPFYERKHTETEKAIMLRFKGVNYYPNGNQDGADYCNCDITFWCPKKLAWQDKKDRSVYTVPFWFIESKIKDVVEKKVLNLTY